MTDKTNPLENDMAEEQDESRAAFEQRHFDALESAIAASTSVAEGVALAEILRTLARPVERFCDVCKGSGEVGGYRGGNGENGGGYETHDCSYCGGTGEPPSDTEIMVMRRDANAGRQLHASLCRRFDYSHDEADWYRDLVSLEEHIAKQIARPVGAAADGDALRAMNDDLCEFAKRWKLNGDWLTCKSCKRNCIASRADEEFQHSAGCKADAEPKPWRRLMAILAPLYAHPAADRVAVPRELIRFLLGEKEMRGVWFGEIPTGERGQYWWRDELRALLAKEGA